ncbi:MAG: hypothetical protein NT062_28560, partial [Proteobacteria bacterium]|nr:hypothetical protein [Pseudomonadota bacterium]
VEDRVRFDVGTIEGITSAIPANAYYLFNPFGENRFSALSHLDEDVELSNARFARDVAIVETLFRTAPRGTYVITYNGFGGQLPTTYVRQRADRQLPNPLCLWQKVSEEPA